MNGLANFEDIFAEKFYNLKVLIILLNIILFALVLNNLSFIIIAEFDFILFILFNLLLFILFKFNYDIK